VELDRVINPEKISAEVITVKTEYIQEALERVILKLALDVFEIGAIRDQCIECA
jgi:hypothetical protein